MVPYIFSALDDAAFMRASKSSSATSSQRERELCSSLGSHLPVFEFTDARLCGGCGGEVQNKARSTRVGRVQAQDTRACADGIRERSLDKARSKSRDVATTGGARAHRSVWASRHARSRARRVSARSRRPPPQSRPVQRETRPAAEPPPVLVVEN